MQEQFDQFCENIKLTTAQRDDAKTKYSGVCKKIHDQFYTHEYNGDTKLIFGSYAKSKNTAIRPMSPNQDVDVLFKIPEEVFNQYSAYKIGGQSALLQKIREILLESRYALGEEPRAWGKVILVKTADGTHNIELLPAYEQEDGTFIIPNSEDSGSWDRFDPRAEIERFRKSNEQTNGLTGDLSRMIKRWSRETASVTIKSFQIENFVIDFLAQNDHSGEAYSKIVRDFFEYLYIVTNEDNRSYVETANNRATKACAFEQDWEIEDATTEWKKVFGDSSFPKPVSTFVSESLDYVKAPKEDFIENLVPVSINSNVEVEVETRCEKQKGGFMRSLLLSQLPAGWIRKEDSLEFRVTAKGLYGDYSTKWKVRNFGEEAERADKLRGEILEDNNGVHGYRDGATFLGEHFLECYVIKDGVCIALKKIIVPIFNK